MNCRVCGRAISPFMTFGRMPIANAFLTDAELASEYFFELAPAFCEGCGGFQLIEQPARERMFHERYAFYSSSSHYMQAHFQALATWLIESELRARPDPLVVELGCNDGVLLRHFKDAGYRHLGIEPSANVAAAARARGLTISNEFFDESLAGRIAGSDGQADVIVAANVMCHIADIHGVAAGIDRLLAPDGVLVFEDPYLGDMLEKTAYDQIYDEHVFILSARSVACAFEPHGLELIDAVGQPTHGGSMRYVLARTGTRPAHRRVTDCRAREARQGLDRAATYDRFRAACEASRDQLSGLLSSLRRERRRVAGYAATSKSTTVTNYCRIGPGEIEFIADTTPLKQGTLSPGTHIPVRGPDAFAARFPDYAVLFAWNHAQEIMAKEHAFRAAGGKWIAFVPRVAVLD